MVGKPRFDLRGEDSNAIGKYLGMMHEGVLDSAVDSLESSRLKTVPVLVVPT
jgi:hypothetical protein